MKRAHPYTAILANERKRRQQAFEAMQKDGYVFGEVVAFDNNKGIGTAVDAASSHYTVHHNNMNRLAHKMLSPGQKIHFKPGVYKDSIIADDVAGVY